MEYIIKDGTINGSNDNMEFNNNEGKNNKDDTNNGILPLWDDVSTKYSGRYSWLNDWNKWSDEEKAKLFCYVTEFIHGYDETAKGNDMVSVINDIIFNYSFKKCREFHKLVVGAYDTLNMKCDLLIFKPVDIYAIQDKYSEIKKSIIKWAEDNGYNDISTN